MIPTKIRVHYPLFDMMKKMDERGFLLEQKVEREKVILVGCQTTEGGFTSFIIQWMN